MRKILSFSFVVISLAALMLFSSCQKDEVLVTRFDATIAGFSNDTKTVLDGQTLKLYWVPGDQIKVFGQGNSYGIYESTDPAETSPFELYSDNAGEGPYRAIYPASCADNQGHLVLPQTQNSTDGSLTEYPMYAKTSDVQSTSLTFNNLCGVICFNLTKANVTVSSIEVTTEHQMTGTFDISENLRLINGSSGTNSVTLMCSTPQNISSQKSFYLYLPPNDYKTMIIKIYTTDGHMCTKTLNAGSTFAVVPGGVNYITLVGNNLDFSLVPGELMGKFSIGANQKVRFSSGNLQYSTRGTHAVADGGTAIGTWRFAPNQFDYIGTGNNNISSSYRDWIDLFGWGTSGWNSQANSSAYYYYQPYNYEGLSGLFYGPGNHDLTGNYKYADWAVYNAISNGGNMPEKWRTLTSDEWVYLLRIRDNASNKCGVGNINGVGGMFLLPDNWNNPDPDNIKFTPGFSDSDQDFSLNTYSLQKWLMLEASGVVFLPAAGYRSGQNVAPLAVGNQGYYQSVSVSGSYNAFYYFYFSSRHDVNPTISVENRSRGLSVRPVRDVTTQNQN